MSDPKKHIAKRKRTDKAFAKDYDKRFEDFKIGVLLRQARESSGITQEQVGDLANRKSLRRHSSFYATQVRRGSWKRDSS